MRKRTVLITISAVLIFILISNIPYVKGFYSLLLDHDHYRYSNADGSFTRTDVKFKGSSYNLKGIVPKECSNGKDTIVYRLFWKNPLCFWRWEEYLSDRRYSLPYKNWNEIKKRRPYALKHSTNCQTF